MPAGKKLMNEIETILNARGPEEGMKTDEMAQAIPWQVSTRAVRYAIRRLVQDGRARPDREIRPSTYFGKKNVSTEPEAHP